MAPATLQVAVNQTANAAVEVRDVAGLYGADIALSFDPQAVEVIDADSNTAGVQVALGTFLDAGFTLRNTADNIGGTVRFAMTQLNPSEAKNGSGVLIVISLRGKEIGVRTPITLTSVQLAQRDGTKLATALVSGEVEVVAAAAGPTSTPILTQAPGTAMPTATRTLSPAEAPTATRISPTSAPPSAKTPTSEASPPVAPTATRISPTSAPPAVATPTPSNTPGGATAGQVRPTATATVTTVVSRSTALISSPLAPTRSAGTTVAILPPGSTMTPAAAVSGAVPNNSARSFQVAGFSLLGLAALLIMLAAVVFLVRRRGHLQQTKKR